MVLRTLLLVEDDPQFVLLVTTLLHRHYPGLADAAPEDEPVVVATTCADAVTRLAADTFDIVLLDLNLPDSQGMQTVRTVTQAIKRSAAPLTPIIVCTGFYESDEVMTSLQLGVQEVLEKPLGTLQALLHAIDRALARTDYLRHLFTMVASGVIL